MATKDLVNLGVAPDSGTGDSARRGGEKINTLFTDIYTNLGDNPVGNDPNGAFYGYRRPFFEFEYKVGEIHQTGKANSISFDSDGQLATYDNTWGWGQTSGNTTITVSEDGQDIPILYRDNHWYFLSRGEILDLNIQEGSIDSDLPIQVVLPLAMPGDTCIVRDAFDRMGGRRINFWTTPYEFISDAQVDEWRTATENENAPGELAISITLANSTRTFRANYKAVNSTLTTYGSTLTHNFPDSQTVDPNDGNSPVSFLNEPLSQYEFVYLGHKKGWVLRQTKLDSADTAVLAESLFTRVNYIDSDLNDGIYIISDSDVPNHAPIVPRVNGVKTGRGGIWFNDGDGNINVQIGGIVDKASLADGAGRVEDYRFLKTTFSLDDNININNNLVVGNTAVVTSNLTVGGDLTVSGTTTTLNTATLTVEDKFIVANSGLATTSQTDLDSAGLVFQRYSSPTTVNYNAAFKWDESNQSFYFGETDDTGASTVTLSDVYFAVGTNPTPADAAFVITYNDPANPTMTGDGTGIIDGGSITL